MVFNQFPEAVVEYEFINRGNTKFPNGFDVLLRRQIDLLSLLKMTKPEHAWLRNIRYIKPTFADWFANYSYNPEEVNVSLKDGDLTVLIRGPWYRTIHWEIVLLAMISELYFQGVEPQKNFETKMVEKGNYLQKEDCSWIDFGTRRRFSFAVQKKLVEIMKQFKGFHGTSNPYLAYLMNVTPVGTYAHEGPMAMQAKYGAYASNQMWNEAWVKEYKGDLGIALTDTLTTPFFLKSFDMFMSKLFDGVRQDSGDPYKIGERYIQHYNYMKIDPRSKRIIFSDSLDAIEGVQLTKAFRHHVKPCLGIGTNFTNDVGVKPLNIVIKMRCADFGHGLRHVVKLSDMEGKVTGDKNTVDHVKWEIVA